MGAIAFEDLSNPAPPDEPVSITDPIDAEPSVKEAYPAAIITIGEDRKDALIAWIEDNILSMESAFADKHKEWAEQEVAYRAKSGAPKSFPFEGANNDIVPLMAMGVDPVFARLDTGIFKNDPVFTVKALKKGYLAYTPSLTRFFNFYQSHKLKLRQVLAPRLLEMVKHGSMVLKTVYDREVYTTKSYDASWKVVDKEVIRFSGPRVLGVNIDRFYFLPGYQDLQACPIVGEKQKVTFGWLKMQEASKKITNVDKLKTAPTHQPTVLEGERETSANHKTITRENETYDIWELWCDYDINGDGIPEKIVVTYHVETKTILQLRYNWYFHQRKPYTLIPYTLTNDSLHGIGLGEMSMMFQNNVTQWHQMATDNAYLANIRMFIAAKDTQIEDKPRLYAGRVLRVNDPSKDLIPFRMGDTYNSTLQERQNILGLAEKRSGISDYLTGRESPIVGSRATATSTLALIDEGTKRVEQVMENVRNGLSEVQENCVYIWMQYGLDDIDDIVFGDDQTAKDVKDFFNALTSDNVAGAIAIDLMATDAKSNRVARQQVQMAIIQVMMTFYEKFVALGTQAIQAQMSMPAVSGLMQEVAESARKLFKELLVQHDIVDPEAYIPELEKYINAAIAGNAGGAGGTPGLPPGNGEQSGLPAVSPAGPGVPGSVPQPPLIPGVSPAGV